MSITVSNPTHIRTQQTRIRYGRYAGKRLNNQGKN